MNASNTSSRVGLVRVVFGVLLLFATVLALIDHLALSRLTIEVRPHGNNVANGNERLAKIEQKLDGIASAPPVVSVTRFDAAQQALQTEIAQIQQAIDSTVRHDEMTAMNDRLSAVESRIASLKSTRAPVSRSLPEITITGHREPVAPFTVLGIEFLGGESFLSLAPLGAATLSQVQMLRVGDTYGEWQLESLDSTAAEFRVGGRTIKIELPTGSSK